MLPVVRAEASARKMRGSQVGPRGRFAIDHPARHAHNAAFPARVEPTHLPMVISGGARVALAWDGMNEAQRLNDPDRTIRRIATVIGWSAVLIIAFVTMAPIGSRPHLPQAGPDIERFLAFVLLAGALSVAYPRRRGLVLALTIGLAIGLEAAQLLEPTRHGRPHDAIVKTLGAMAGAALATLMDRLARGLRRAH
jgi:hypothetical protein